MTAPRPRPAGSGPPATRRFSPLVLVLILTSPISGCARAPDSGGDAIAHVHGLAVDPTDPERLFVATHHGLFRGDGDATWTRVTRDPFDMMGFTIHPRDPSLMYASGHPAYPKAGERFVGVVKSTDAGATWATLALANQVDFHAFALSRADPNRLWGFFANAVYRSDDAGTTWVSFAPSGMGNPAAFAPGGASRDHLFAATPEGLYRSDDGGHHWHGLHTSAGPATALATAASDALRILAYFPTAGAILSTADGGASWRPMNLTLAPGERVAALAVDPQRADVAYAATNVAVYRSDDDGATWRSVRALAG